MSLSGWQYIKHVVIICCWGTFLGDDAGPLTELNDKEVALALEPEYPEPLHVPPNLGFSRDSKAAVPYLWVATFGRIK